MVLQVSASEYSHQCLQKYPQAPVECARTAENRGALRIKPNMLFLLPHPAHLAYKASSAPSPTHAVYLPISWMSLVTADLPSFPFPLLASLICHIPGGIPYSQPTLPGPHLSIQQQALLPSREEQQSGTAVTLGRARCIS